ncbi:MAG: gamma-glutamyltransferase [Candidatus Cyclobacteriaceae bacterium M3_2C_046]
MKINLVFLFLSLSMMQLSAQDRLSSRHFATRSEVLATNGMAATSQPLATMAAIDILQKGGSAVDAAIAANAVLAVVEPTSNGLGGDIFAIVWNAPDQDLYGFNGSGRSPQSLDIEVFREKGYEQIPYRGALPISVPGAVDGWFQLHQKFGKLPMTEVLQPAIEYARNGFPVTELIAFYWSFSESYKDQPGFSDVFLINGKPPQKGDIFKNPALANTLEKIARQGRDVFYEGEIASVMVEFVKKAGGYLSEKDLADHQGEWLDPVSTNYRGYDVWELPPNGQGIAVLQMLNILEGYDLSTMGYGSADYIHTLVEAKKLAFADRAKFYADMDFNDIPVDELISDTYADKRRTLIDQTAARQVAPGEPTSLGETIYLTTADQEGNMVSLIQSNYTGFGSGVTPPLLGFGFQNRGQLFTLEEGHFNMYEPGKRPFHTIIPGFVTKEGKPWLSFGVMGGDMQPQGHVQVLVNMIDFGMNVQEAGDAPRVRHSGSAQPTGTAMNDGGQVHLEAGFAPDVIQELIKRGHKVVFGGSYGGYQAIKYDATSGVYFGGSESRKDGMAAGY